MTRLNEAINYEKYKDLMDKALFDEFLDMDPSKDKKYAAWIILWFMKGLSVKDAIEKLDKIEENKKYPLTLGMLWSLGMFGPNTTDVRKIVRFIREDHSKVTEDLEAYDFLKRKHGLASERDYNIMNVSGFDALANLVEDRTFIKDSLENESVGPDEYEKWYEDGHWTVVIPKTVAAAKKYGANTRWCTAARNDNMFDRYNATGDLIVFIDKASGRKWQIHLASKQWMDERDHEIDKLAFIAGLPIEVREALFDRTKDIRFAIDPVPIVGGLFDENPDMVKTWVFRHIYASQVANMLRAGEDPGIDDRVWGLINPSDALFGKGKQPIDELIEKIMSDFSDAERTFGSQQCEVTIESALYHLDNEGTTEEITRAIVAIMNSPYNKEELVTCVNKLIAAKIKRTLPYTKESIYESAFRNIARKAGL